MDNNSAGDITLDRIESDISAIASTRFQSIRKLSELQAIYAVLQQLQLQLAAKPVPPNHVTNTVTRRRLITMRRIIQSQLINARRRIAQVERMNEKKVNAQRTQRNNAQLLDALIESKLLTSLVKETRIARSESMRENKQAAQIARAELVPAIQKQFADVGYNPLATSAERAEWERLRDINRHAIPGTDLSSQGDELTRMLKDAEQERAQPSQPNSAELPDDVSTIGSADEWFSELPEVKEEVKP